MTPNELLRAHVTRIGFNLALTKNQIAELVYLDIELSDSRPFGERLQDGPRLDNQAGRHLLTNHIATRSALITRGLVVHYPPPERRNNDDRWMHESMRDRWTITPAGRLVIDLLRQSGLWDDVAAEIPWAVKPEPRQPFTADDEIKHLRERLDRAAQELKEMREQRDKEHGDAIRARGERARAERRLAELREQVRDLTSLPQFAALGVAVGADAA